MDQETRENGQRTVIPDYPDDPPTKFRRLARNLVKFLAIVALVAVGVRLVTAIIEFLVLGG